MKWQWGTYPMSVEEALHKVRAERTDDTVDQLRRLMQHFENRLTLADPRLAERYDRGELDLLLYFGVRGASDNHVAHLNRAGVGRVHEHIHLRHDDLIAHRVLQHLGHHRSDVEAGRMKVDHKQQAVFVGIVQFIEDPESVSLPTLVRFERQEVFDGTGGQSLYFSLQRGFVLRSSVLSTNKEGDITVGCRPGVINQVEVLNQVVERGTQVLDNITGDDTEERVNLWDLGKAIDWASGLRIALDRESIQIGIEQCMDALFELREVMFGPFDLLPDHGQPFVGCHE